MIPAVLAAVAGLAAVLILVFRQVAATDSHLPVTVEWMESLSVDRYRPMLRLLDQGDLSFLRSQPGFKPAMASRLRRQRCNIFKSYLHNLTADFRRTCSALRMVMLHADNDRPDLATALLRAQAAFAWGMIQVQFHLTLYRLGMASVDVTGLVSLFDVMQLELRSFVPADAASAA
ncbi:conserved exported hypothetical protein [Candidatus Sulfopaludibacter sp. SbA3]|nr:conserved exported hypothetical protein [Candidatus Sulfopaludibacter sp. SbA3]